MSIHKRGNMEKKEKVHYQFEYLMHGKWWVLRGASDCVTEEEALGMGVRAWYIDMDNTKWRVVKVTTVEIRTVVQESP